MTLGKDGTPGGDAENADVLAGTVAPNLGGSGGFEGMAINPQGDRLYTLLEKSVTGDPAGSLRINEFSIDSEAYTDQQWLYRLDPSGTAIGDMVAINDHEFIVIERNGATATSGTPFKKLFKINLKEVDEQGFVDKAERVALTSEGVHADASPAWSPDGRTAAVTGTP